MGASSGDVIGERYRVVEPIGSGGMGAVFRAEVIGSSERVAIKLIRPETLNDRSVARFTREAKLAAQVRHPHVVEVLDSGVTREGEPWLAMELLEGQSFEDRLIELPPPTVEEVIRWTCEALEGLAAVHDLGILHRDLKPANLYLAERGAETTVKLLDFGLSRSVGEPTDGSPVPSLTQTHQFLGTPFYASPEQVRSAKRIDHRADLFSMGVILYEALAGRRPFDGPSAAAVIAAVVADDPTPLGALRPDLPKALVDVVHRAIAREPSARYGDARELSRALRETAVGVAALRVTPRSVTSRPPVARLSPRVESGGRASNKTVSTTPARSGGPWLGVIATLLGLAMVGLVVLFVFGTGEDASTTAGSGPESAMANAVPVAPVSAMPQRLAGPLSLASLGMRFRALPAGSSRGDLRFVRDGAGYSIVALSGVPPATVRSLAARLGGEPVPFTAPLEGTLVPELLHTTVSLNVREGPGADAPLVRTLPHGTIVVGYRGRVDGVDSRRAGMGSWMWVAVTDTDEGFSAGRFLEPDEGCVPEHEAVLEPLPEARRAVLTNDTLVGRVAMYRDAEGFDGVWAIARDVERQRSHVLAYRAGSGCALDLVSRYALDGLAVDMLFTETEENAGDTLVVVATVPAATPDPRGEETWTVFRLGHPRPVYLETVASSQRLPRNRRASLSTRLTTGPDGGPGYFPLLFRHGNGQRETLAWTGDRLEAIATPAPSGEEGAPSEGSSAPTE